MVKKSSGINTRLFVVIGILAIAIILGSIFGSKYMEKFTTEKTLVYFYMNNCPFCNDFESEWTKIENIVESKAESIYSSLKLQKINLQSSEGKDYKEISGAPTIMLLPSRTIYDGKREASAILDWAVR